MTSHPARANTRPGCASASPASPVKARLVAAAVSLPVLLVIAYYALLAPQIEFLRPSMAASWIVHPPELGKQGHFGADFHSADVYFFRSFRLDAPASSFEIHITALDRFALTINGRALPLVAPGNWKRGSDLDLTPHLRVGDNRIMIRVSYPKGTPALLVEGRGEARELISDRHWYASQTRSLSDAVPAARALEGFPAGRESPLRASPHFAGWRLLCYGLLAFTGYALVPIRFKPWLREPRRESAPRSFANEYGLCIAIFLVVATVQIYNAATLGSTRGMPDARGHVAYVLYVAEHWRAPLAEEGWQMYHPPLFYFVAASLRTILTNFSAWFSGVAFLRVLSTCFGLATIAVSWLLIQRLLPQRTLARNLGFTLIAMLPVAFYMNPNVTNAVFAASIAGCTVLASVVILFGAEVSWGRALLLGILCGLSLLSKFTGVFVLASVLALLTLRALVAGRGLQRRGIVKFGFVLAASALTVAGWFYLRNWLHYGDPFAGNWDYATGFHYEQSPGYRTAGFYTNLGALPWQLPERTSSSSFWEVMYATFWADPLGFFLPRTDARVDLLQSLILCLAVFPTAGIALGFLRACRFLVSDGWDHPFFILVTTGFWTLAAIVLFTLELPFYSTVRAFFGLSLIPAIGVFAGLGLEQMSRQLGRLRLLMYAELACLYGLILVLFTVR